MKSSIPKTFQEHVFDEQSLPEKTRSELVHLLWDFLIAVKSIHNKTSKAGLIDILGEAGHHNASGDTVKKLDRIAHETVIAAMQHGGWVAALASEEEETVLAGEAEGKYILAFDPLDGSSNIDANVSIGTIFSIFPAKKKAASLNAQVLRKGTEQLMAGYVIYGASTMLVYTVGNGTHGFTLDPAMGEFYLSHPSIHTPANGKVYSINEVNEPYFDTAMKTYLQEIKASGRYTGRYIGSLVADVHRNLLYGGVYAYMATPLAKLRLLYEGFPLAFIVEQAGGSASNGQKRILDLIPQELHQRTPLVIGSKNDVSRYEQLVKQFS